MITKNYFSIFCCCIILYTSNRAMNLFTGSITCRIGDIDYTYTDGKLIPVGTKQADKVHTVHWDPSKKAYV